MSGLFISCVTMGLTVSVSLFVAVIIKGLVAILQKVA
jgi:hypothetical protein